MSKINAHPDHLRRSGGKLSDFGGQLAEGGQKLETTGQNLVSHASGDRSGIGAVVAKLFGKGVQITGKVFSEGGRVVEGAGNRLGTSADLYEEADGRGAGLLRKLHSGDERGIHPHRGGTRAVPRVWARAPVAVTVPRANRCTATSAATPFRSTDGPGPRTPSTWPPARSCWPRPIWTCPA